MSDLRIGIIGAGQIVEGSHLPALLACSGVKVEWIADSNEVQCNRLARMFGLKSVPIRQAIDNIKDLDICLLAIPYGVRKVYLEECSKHRIAVYVEKPLAKSAAEHLRLVESIGATRLAIGFQRRFYRSFGTLREIVLSNVFGSPSSISVQSQSFSLRSGGGGYKTDSSVAGGGIVIELGIHLVDLVVDLLQPTEIVTTKVEGVIEDGIDYHVNSEHEILCRFGRVPIECQFSLLVPGFSGIVINFGRTIVTMDMNPEADLYVKSLDTQRVFRIETMLCPPKNQGVTSAQAFACAWADFSAAVREEKLSTISAIHSIQTTKWIESIYEGLGDG